MAVATDFFLHIPAKAKKPDAREKTLMVATYCTPKKFHHIEKGATVCMYCGKKAP